MVANMFDHRYLTPAHIDGFKKYKYSSIDTSPLSQYVMHPLWNTLVKIVPRNVAPNLLTFSGFLCAILALLILSVFDYDCSAAGGKSGSADGLPKWMYTLCGILLFTSYNLDGIDGKQARKIGVSGPLGELFDHGLDSYTVFVVPLCLFSVFGREHEYSLSTFRGYLIVLSVVSNFYVSHVEKYNTGTLYLPWGYDLSMWVVSGMFLAAGMHGSAVYRTRVAGLTFVRVLELAIHITGIFTTLPISIYNIYLSRKNGACKNLSMRESFRPIWSILGVVGVTTFWGLVSPNDIVGYDPRAFLVMFGTLFSNVTSRLIVAAMSNHRCELFNWLTLPTLAGCALSLYRPLYEIKILYSMVVLVTLAHVHYGVCVVRQLCDHYGMRCFFVHQQKKL